LSGLHLGILLIPLTWAASYLPVGRKARSVCILALIACYSLLAGLPPSLVRATALVAVFMILRSMGRKTTLARSLLLAIFILVLIDEQILYSGGFQLSCSAVLGIAFLGIPMSSIIRSRLRGRILTGIVMLFMSPALITFSVNIVTLPIILSFFGRAPLIAPACNLLMVVPVTLLLYLGLAYAVLPFWPVRPLTAIPINLISEFLYEAPLSLSKHHQPAILSGSIYWPLYIAGTVIFAAAVRKSCRRRMLFVSSALALLISSLLIGGGRGVFSTSSGTMPYQEPHDLSSHVIVLSDRLLVIEEDIGRWEAEMAVRALWKRGTGSIETLLICPARLGGRGGVEYIVSRIDFTQVMCSPYLGGHDGGLADILRSCGIEAQFVERSDSLEMCGWKICLIAPPYPPSAEAPVPMELASIRFVLKPGSSMREIEN
jgi:ComEC/Rec2-related protein